MASSASAFEERAVDPEGSWQRASVAGLHDQPLALLSARPATRAPVHRLSPDPLADYRWPQPAARDQLEIFALAPVAAVADDSASFTGLATAGGERCSIRVSAAGSVRVDFGVECAGWLEFDSPDLAGEIELSISEHTRPLVVNSRAPAPERSVKTAPPVRHGSTYRLELNRELYEGARFGWIHVRAVDRPWTITAIRLACRAKPANYDGHFAASDPLLTRIWYAGAYSVRVNFAADHFGPALTDRGDRFSEEGGVWAGDSHPSQAAALVVFGNAEFVRQNLEQTSATSNGIELYGLMWLLSLADYLWHTGDAEALEHFRPVETARVERALGLFAAPPIAFCGHDERLGAAFEEAQRPETEMVYRLVLIRCLRELAAVYAALGRSQLADPYAECSRRLEAAVRESGWTASLGAHALADAINSGVLAPGDANDDVQRELGDRLSRISFSPFNAYFVLQALARLGWIDQALTTVRDLWGSQLAYGATTLLEVFRPEWLDFVAPNAPVPNCQVGWTSLAHAWGGGVSAWLTHEILGVRPTRPGFAEVEVMPRLGGTLDWAEGTVPTPRGLISARFDVEGGRHIVVVPDGITATVGVPLTGRPIDSLWVDGRNVAAEVDGDAALIRGLGPGRHEFTIVAPGRRPTAVTEELCHPIGRPCIDRSGGGDWRAAYGRDGWSIIGPAGPSEQLPEYVDSVGRAERGAGIVNRPGGVGRGLVDAWCVQDSDLRLLVDPQTGGRSRGYLRTATPDWWGMTMTVDVAVVPRAHYRLTAYFLDADECSRELVIELIDLETRKLLARPVLVADFARGTYVGFDCDRPVRLRIDHLSGPNAVLSGLFFDPLS